MERLPTFRQNYWLHIKHFEGQDWYCAQDIMNLVNESIGPISHRTIGRDVSPRFRRTMRSVGLIGSNLEGKSYLKLSSYLLNETGVYQLLVRRRRRVKAAEVNSWFCRMTEFRWNNRNNDPPALNDF